jgi:hypothetical protein
MTPPTPLLSCALLMRQDQKFKDIMFIQHFSPPTITPSPLNSVYNGHVETLATGGPSEFAEIESTPMQT